MTTTTPANRPVVGLLFALAGILATISFILSVAHTSGGAIPFGILTDGALTLGFLLLTLGRGSGTLARLFFAIATVGWAILTIGGLVDLGVVLKVGVVLALVGSLISGILVFAGKSFSKTANLAFLLATILIAIVLLNQLVPYLSGVLAYIVIGLYAVLLLIAGILITARK